jgi:preprotein translocase subunit SecG
MSRVAGLAVSIGITSYNVLIAVVILQTATGSDLGGLLSWGAGIVHTVFGVLF